MTTRNSLNFTLALLVSAISWTASAQVISNSAREVSFEYEATFLLQGTKRDAASEAQDHSGYMFGVFSSPEYVSKYGVDPELVEGVGAPQIPMNIEVLSVEKIAGGKSEVHYKASGTLLLQKNVAKKALATGELKLPMPYDLENIYDEKCTDEHYNTIGDYWYFYDPFQDGCTYLLKAPYTNEVTMSISAMPEAASEKRPNLEGLRGDNGNGAAFKIYLISGFEEGSTARSDAGRRNFGELNDYFKRNGFEETVVQHGAQRPLYLYTKTIDGVEMEIHHLLTNTDAASRGVTFARFFKEAVSEGDVIIYSGHSGLGGNLDIPTIESQVGKLKFPKNKQQIFIFDSCSSYSYYLDEFRRMKPDSKIDIITSGLSNYFETSALVLDSFLDIVLDPTQNDISWKQIMRKMEEPLNGVSYLVNVGGV